MDDDFSISQGNGLGGDGGRRRREEKRAEACEGGSSEQPLSPPPPLSLKEVVGERSRRRCMGRVDERRLLKSTLEIFSRKKRGWDIFEDASPVIFSRHQVEKYACSCPLTPKDGVGALFLLPSWLRENHLFSPSPPFPQEWAAHLSIKRGGGGGKKGGLDRVRKTHKAEMGRKRWVKILLPSSLSFGFGYRPRKKEKNSFSRLQKRAIFHL